MKHRGRLSGRDIALLGYFLLSNSALTRSPASVRVLPVKSTTVSKVRNGLPRQFCVMWQNTRAQSIVADHGRRTPKSDGGSRARPAALQPYNVQTTTPHPSSRHPPPSASPSPARRSITTRCPSSAPHFAMYPNVCFTPSSTVHARLLRAESRNTLHSTTNRSHRSDGCPGSRGHSTSRSVQPVLPLDTTATVHHPVQVRLQDELRSRLGVLAEAPQPMLGMLPEEHAERRQQLRHVQPPAGC